MEINIRHCKYRFANDSLINLSLSRKLIPFDAQPIFKFNCNKSGMTNEQVVVGLSEYIRCVEEHSAPVSQIIYNLALKDLNARVA